MLTCYSVVLLPENVMFAFLLLLCKIVQKVPMCHIYIYIHISIYTHTNTPIGTDLTTFSLLLREAPECDDASTATPMAHAHMCTCTHALIFLAIVQPLDSSKALPLIFALLFSCCISISHIQMHARTHTQAHVRKCRAYVMSVCHC